MFRPLLLALSFLTLFPAGGRTEYRDSDFGRSVIYFPVIGFILGTIALYGAEYLFSLGMKPGVTAFIIIVYLQVVTRALHMDGLADTIDGFFGGKGSEDALRIMKDPSTGPFGITAIVIVLLGTYIALEADLAGGSYTVIVPALVLSRWGMAAGAYNSRYPREAGTAKLFIGNIGVNSFLVSTILAALLASLYVGVQAVQMLFATALLVLSVRFLAKRKINGMTGDCLGAINELTVLMLLFAF